VTCSDAKLLVDAMRAPGWRDCKHGHAPSRVWTRDSGQWRAVDKHVSSGRIVWSGRWEPTADLLIEIGAAMRHEVVL
jgi:hypothetical protein